MPSGRPYDSHPHHSFLESLFGSSHHHHHHSQAPHGSETLHRSPLDVYAERASIQQKRGAPLKLSAIRQTRNNQQTSRPGQYHDFSAPDVHVLSAQNNDNNEQPGRRKAGPVKRYLSDDNDGAAPHRGSRGAKKNSKLQLCKCIIDAEFHANKDPKKRKQNIKTCIATHYSDPKPDDYGKKHVPSCIPVTEGVFKSLKKTTLKNIARALHVPVPHDQDDFDTMKIKPLREYLMTHIAKTHPKFMVPAFQHHAIQVGKAIKAAHHPHHHFF